jgi:hypothetical protein
MTLYPGVDASREPGTPLPFGTRILCGYIGALDLAGRPDTPHIWTRDEWNAYADPDSPLVAPQDKPFLRLLPIFTRDFAGNPDNDANNAADAAIDLGWSHDGSRVILRDAEFFRDDSYSAAFRARLNLRGFKDGTYEQTPTQDPSAQFRWIFDLVPRQPKALPPGWDGWQWAFPNTPGGVPGWDRSVFSQRMYDYCGQGPRKVNP